MSDPRTIAPVVRITRLTDLDERADRQAYWAGRSVADRLLELESLRRMWPEITGDPDLPIVRVVHRRKLGEPARLPPEGAHSAG